MTRARSLRRLAPLAWLAALVLCGCASARSHARPAEAAPPAAASAPGAPPPAAPGQEVTPGGQVPRAGGPVRAPWDTAATAAGRAGQHNHVYPSGLSPLGKKLVDALPEPAGVTDEEAPASVAPAAPAPSGPAPAPAAPAPTPPDSAATATPGIGESGCWEVQLLVTTDRGKAEDVCKRVRKQLDLAAWVRVDGSLYRVRAGGCLSPDGAGELARQLKQKGFPEAFRVMRDTP